jgi:hypothetical protein
MDGRSDRALRKVMSASASPQQLAISHRICCRLLLLSASAVGIFAAWTSAVVADQQQRTVMLQVARTDFPAAQALMNRTAALSPRVRAEEAAQLAGCAYNTARQLRRDYRVVWPPLFNNFLINSGIRKRGLCFQWAEDLLTRLDTLKLATLELHWGEADVGTWQESNCVVVTAKGQPFNRGIILDCWRHSGHLYWTAVANDKVSWVENRAYAHFVRAKLAAAANHHVALQTETDRERKPADALVTASAKAH